MYVCMYISSTSCHIKSHHITHHIIAKCEDFPALSELEESSDEEEDLVYSIVYIRYSVSYVVYSI